MPIVVPGDPEPLDPGPPAEPIAPNSIPARRNFVGFRGEFNDGVRQGTDWRRAQTFRNAMTGALVDMSAFQAAHGGTTRGNVESADGEVVYFSTEHGTLLLSWLDASTLELRIPASASAAIPAPDDLMQERVIPNTAVYQIEGFSAALPTMTQRILQGRIEMDRELVTQGV